MLYLFTVYRRRTEAGVEYFAGTFTNVPIAGYWDRVEVSKLTFRLDEKVVKYVRKIADGLDGKQRFHELGHWSRQRATDGKEFFCGVVINIPVVAYWDYKDVDKLNAYVDEKALKVMSDQGRKEALEKKAKILSQQAATANQPACV